MLGHAIRAGARQEAARRRADERRHEDKRIRLAQARRTATSTSSRQNAGAEAKPAVEAGKPERRSTVIASNFLREMLFARRKGVLSVAELEKVEEEGGDGDAGSPSAAGPAAPEHEIERLERVRRRGVWRAVARWKGLVSRRRATEAALREEEGKDARHRRCRS